MIGDGMPQAVCRCKQIPAFRVIGCGFCSGQKSIIIGLGNALQNIAISITYVVLSNPQNSIVWLRAFHCEQARSLVIAELGKTDACSCRARLRNLGLNETAQKPARLVIGIYVFCCCANITIIGNSLYNVTMVVVAGGNVYFGDKRTRRILVCSLCGGCR